MAVGFSSVPQNLRVPLFYAEIDASQAGRGADAQRSLLIGQKLAAGSSPALQPVLVTSPDQADGLFGAGSMLAAMVRAYRRADDFGELWALPLADPTGTKSTRTLTVSGPATAGGIVPLYVAGVLVQVPVAAADTADDVAAAIAAAVNANARLPVTAVAADEVVTLTARHDGLAAGDVDVRIAYRGAAGGEALPAGVGVAVSALTAGTGVPSLTAAFAAMGDVEYDFVAVPYTDSGSLDAVKEEWDAVTGRWGWQQQVYGHVFSAAKGTVGALSALGAARNDPAVSIVDAADSPTPAWSWAAAAAGTCAVSLRADPARPLQTLEIRGVLAPPARRTRSEQQVLLFDGIATHMVGADGTVRVQRMITTYQTNAFGQGDTAWLDVETRYTLAAVLRRLRSVVTTKYARHKLANDGTQFGPGQAIVTPRILRAEMIAQYAEMEAIGWVENRDAFAANLIVERNADDPNRVDVLYPPDLVNGLRIVAVLAQFRLQYAA